MTALLEFASKPKHQASMSPKSRTTRATAQAQVHAGADDIDPGRIHHPKRLENVLFAGATWKWKKCNNLQGTTREPALDGACHKAGATGQRLHYHERLGEAGRPCRATATKAGEVHEGSACLCTDVPGFITSSGPLVMPRCPAPLHQHPSTLLCPALTDTSDMHRDCSLGSD